MEVLEAAGFQVIVPEQDLCCGRPLYDYGMLDTAKRWLQQILTALQPQIEAGIPVVGHVGLTVDAPMKEVKEFGERFQKRFKYKPDHNGLKGYTAVYAMKYVTEKKLGKFDRKALASTLHGLTITPSEEPGILIETGWDNVGEIDRISFLAEVVKGQQQIVKILPKLGK